MHLCIYGESKLSSLIFKMSGTLFIVCIPTRDKEEILKDNNMKKNINQKSFIEKKTSEVVIDLHKGISTQDRDSVCLPIEHMDDLENKEFEKSSTLQRTKSCDNILVQENFLSVDATNLKFRKSLDDSRSSNCPKTKRKQIHSNDLQLNILRDSSMELVLTKIFQKLKIENTTWQKSNDSYSVMFSIPTGVLHEQVLKFFNYWGIGERPGSSVTMLPATVILPSKSINKDEDEVFSEELSVKDQGLWDGFMNSINARMNVAKIVEELRQDAALTFDYVTLIIIAGIMAAFGLIENSIICLTSSMLISPLMGPLIAATFSTVIKDKQLMKFGVINELIGIFLATLVGFVFGLIVGSVDERYGVGDGLGEEILSRCEIHSLVIGVFTAIPSGAAVAIAILGENIGSLVGVAISASLLPPAVNAGLLWALAVLFMIHRSDENIYNSVIKMTVYSDNQAVELAILGSISMAVTLINVICIYGTGILFLKIKEVAPTASKSQQQFWKHDVKVARDYNKTLGTGEGASFQEKIFEDFAQFQGHEFRTLTAEATRNKRFSNQYTWSPRMNHNRTTRISIQELEKLYCNPSNNKIEVRPTKRLNRVGVLGKSMSPTKYHQLTNEMGGSDSQFQVSKRNRNVPTSSTTPLHQVFNDMKVNETSQKSTATAEIPKKAVPAKSKFIVTPAVDPLHLNKR